MPLRTNMFDSILPFLGLFALLAAGWAIIARMRREATGCDVTDEAIGADFQAAYDRGEIDREEYERIKESLRRRQAERPSHEPRDQSARITPSKPWKPDPIPPGSETGLPDLE